MDKDLHSIDNLFRSAIEPHEESPSPELWQALDAMLNKQETDNLRKKLSVYRRIAAVLIFMLLSHSLYDLMIIHKNGGKNYATIFSDADSIINTKREASITDQNESMPNKERARNIRNENIRSNFSATKRDINKNNTPSAYNTKDIAADKKDKIMHYSPSSGKIITGVAALPEKDSGFADASKEKDSINIFEKADTSVANKKNIAVLPEFKPSFSITPLIAKEWAKYNLENNIENNGTGQSEENKDEVAQRENQEPSFTAGVLINYQFREDMSVQSGLLYSRTAISIDPHTIYAAKAPDGSLAYRYNSSSGYAYLNPKFDQPVNVGDSIYTSDAQHNLTYISFPLMLKYKKNFSKLYFAPSLGLTANILLSSKIQTELKDASNTEKITISKLKGLNHFYAGYMFNVELGYNLNDQWAVNVHPYIKNAITPINSTNIVKTYPYSVGLGLGISYKF